MAERRNVEDCGFELPDTRHTFYTKDGYRVSVVIIRHWYHEEDSDEPTFKVSFDLGCTKDGKTNWVSLPVGVDESKAIDTAHLLWEEDEEYTREYNECEAIEAAERRMGA